MTETKRLERDMKTSEIYVAVQQMALTGKIRLRVQGLDSDGEPVDVYFEPDTLAKLMENANNVMEVTVKVGG
tara:strand:- start:748 stop:963 length:216 start_codon:yes stop_codon:yes gene_type:complete